MSLSETRKRKQSAKRTRHFMCQFCEAGREENRATLSGRPRHFSCQITFIPLFFWYDAPLISRDSDRRHDRWLVYGSPTYKQSPQSSRQNSRLRAYPNRLLDGILRANMLSA